MVKVAGKQSLGKRENQEDAFKLVFQDENDLGSDILMIVADGMGGHAGGEVASNLVCRVFGQHFVSHATATRPRPRLEQSLYAANNAVADKIAEEPALQGMGCTLVAALKIDERLSWISVGDSVLFLLRDAKLTRLNADHSLYGELLQLVQEGKLSKAEADQHPKRNALRSAITGKPVSLIDLEAVELRPEDLVLIATDGVETLSDDEILAILTREKRPDVRSVCSDLLNAVEAKQKPKQDNTTVIAYRHSNDERTSASSKSQWAYLGDGPIAKSSSTSWPLPLVGGVIVAAVVALVALILLVLPANKDNTSEELTLPDTQVEPEEARPEAPRVPRSIDGGRLREDDLGIDPDSLNDTTNPTDPEGPIVDEQSGIQDGDGGEPDAQENEDSSLGDAPVTEVPPTDETEPVEPTAPPAEDAPDNSQDLPSRVSPEG